MKAIHVTRFGDPAVLRLAEVNDPVPAAGQVLVRIHAAGVNPVETYIRAGTYARAPQLPYTPGHDGAGVVEAVGDDASGLRVGDRVYVAGSLSGTYAELALCAVDDVHPLPDNTSFAQGAALGIPCATAYRALFQRAHAKPGETVLVHGATGAVGLAAVQLARAAGLHVMATGGSDAGRQALAAQGAHRVFDHHADNHAQAVLDATDGGGVDVVIEMLADANLGHDLAILARGGRIVVVGNHGTAEINPRDLMARDTAILGMLLWNTPPDDAREIHAALYAALESGALKPVVARELVLADAPLAHQLVMQNGKVGKIVLVP